MAKIGASGKNILRGRSPWLGVPRAGVGGLGAIGPNGNYPDAEGNTTCPEVNGMSNPYNYKGYFLPPGKACIHPGGGAHTVNPDGTYYVDSCDLTPDPDFRHMTPPETPFKDIESKFKKVGEKGIKASDTVGYGAGWGTSTEVRTVVGIFWPSTSELENYTGPDWTQAEFMTLMGNNLKKGIRDYTHGQLELVGGPYMPDTGANNSDLDFVWVGNPDSPNPTNPCGTTGGLICDCGGPEGFRTKMGDWFMANGYGNGASYAGDVDLVGYDLKIGIVLGGCPEFPDIAGNAGSDPFVWTAVMPEAGLANDPPALLDLTSAAQVLGDARVTQVTLHEIGHSVGHSHTAKYYPQRAGLPAMHCYDNYHLAPHDACNGVSYSYEGVDNLDLMSFGGASENRYGAWEEAHFTAFKKFVTNKGARPVTGPADRVHFKEKFPPQCVHFPDPAAAVDGVQKITIFAHDQAFDDPDMVANVADSKTMILLIRRDIDRSEMWIENNCVYANLADDCPTEERYLAISYRRSAWFRPLDVHGPNIDGPNNGALVVDWGPQGIGAGFGCPSHFPARFATGVIKKIDAEDYNTVLRWDAYTANGRSFPELEIKILDNKGNPGNRGPNDLFIQVKQT